MKVADIIRSGLSRITGNKSLNDRQAGADAVTPTPNANVSVVRTPSGGEALLSRKRSTLRWRRYAERSTIVRSAINIYRDCIERAEWRVVPYDPTRPLDKRVKADIESLLRQPNPAGESYGTIKAKLVEDYLVIGHGAVEKAIRRDAAPRQLYSLDAARLGFVEGWDGTDPEQARYVELDPSGRARRWLPDAMAMVLVNCPRSYDSLGLSHVEVLDTAIRSMLEGDDTFLKQLEDRTPGGVLDLGEGFTKSQVDQFRQEIQQLRSYFAVMSGGKNGKFISFNASERDIRSLDKLLYFKRQVAGIFQLPMAMLGETVDTSRANTEAMLANSDNGPGALLWRIKEMENAQIVLRHGPYEEHNACIDYPIMGRRDEKQQAEITSIQTGKSAWASTNEARRSAGLQPLEMEIADEVLIPTRGGPVPLSRLNEQYFGDGAGGDDGDDDQGGDDEK